MRGAWANPHPAPECLLYLGSMVSAESTPAAAGDRDGPVLPASLELWSRARGTGTARGRGIGAWPPLPATCDGNNAV